MGVVINFILYCYHCDTSKIVRQISLVLMHIAGIHCHYNSGCLYAQNFCSVGHPLQTISARVDKPGMPYNSDRELFRFVTNHTFDKRMDGETDGQTDVDSKSAL